MRPRFRIMWTLFLEPFCSIITGFTIEPLNESAFIECEKYEQTFTGYKKVRL